MTEARTTQNHETIKDWVEERGGAPAVVKSTRGGSSGILRIDFPGGAGGKELEPVSWQEFFEIFDKESLSFLYQDELEDGAESRFCKFISEDTASQQAS